MDKTSMTAQLNQKHKEIFDQYFEILTRRKESAKNEEIEKVFNVINSNIKYIENYLSALKIEDKDEMKKAIEKNDCVKELNSVLYGAEERNKKIINNPKVQVM
jgi:hypothetical protein